MDINVIITNVFGSNKLEIANTNKNYLAAKYLV